MAVTHAPVFTRDDGRTLQVVEGLADRVLAAAQFAPRDDWDDERYAAKARKKVRQVREFLDSYRRHGGAVDGTQALEVACGAGIESLLVALQPVAGVVGIDCELPLFDGGGGQRRARRLAGTVLNAGGVDEALDAALRERPLFFARADATHLPFPSASFDLIWSHSAMEHIIPVERALAEMARILRPGGLMYHAIDPYYWLKGCHKGGVVDLPWAHARLTAAEYHRFVAESEGEARAQKRSAFIATLNHFTARDWQRTLDAAPFEILEWTEERWPLAESLLADHPDVIDTLVDGVQPSDLVCREVKVWLRRRT